MNGRFAGFQNWFFKYWFLICLITFIATGMTLGLTWSHTLPGMTSRGLVPLAARTAGIDFTRLVERLVRQARRATP